MLSVVLYLVSFIRTLLVFIVVFLIFRWILKLLIPNKNNQQQDQQKNKEGETTVHFSKKGEKLIDKDKGEYVDFEEID